MTRRHLPQQPHLYREVRGRERPESDNKAKERPEADNVPTKGKDTGYHIVNGKH